MYYFWLNVEKWMALCVCLCSNRRFEAPVYDVAAIKIFYLQWIYVTRILELDNKAALARCFGRLVFC